jgi:hypothetical protein
MNHLKLFESFKKIKSFKSCINKNILNQLTWNPTWNATPHYENKINDMRCVFYTGEDLTGDNYFENNVYLIYGKFHEDIGSFKSPYFLIIEDAFNEITTFEKGFKTFEEGLEFIQELTKYYDIETMWFDFDGKKLVNYEEWHSSDKLRNLNNKTGLFN